MIVKNNTRKTWLTKLLDYKVNPRITRLIRAAFYGDRANWISEMTKSHRSSSITCITLSFSFERNAKFCSGIVRTARAHAILPTSVYVYRVIAKQYLKKNFFSKYNINLTRILSMSNIDLTLFSLMGRETPSLSKVLKIFSFRNRLLNLIYNITK